MGKTTKEILQETASMANSAAIVVFSKSPCPYCREAKELLQAELGERYSEVKIYFLDKIPNGTAIHEALLYLTGQKTVPNIFIQGKSVGGCSELKTLKDHDALEPLLSQIGLVIVKPGAKIPSTKVHLVTWSAQEGAYKINPVDAADFFKDKKAVVFGVPGAFSPACSDARECEAEKHLPGYLVDRAKFQEQGVDVIVCLAVNDPFVLRAWATHHQVGDKVVMMADGNGELVGKLGLLQDSSAGGMGRRARRFAMLVRDGKVRHVVLEKPRTTEASTSQAMLPLLSKL